jgi:hypothetical protein
MPAWGASGTCPADYPMGHECIERQTAPLRTLPKMWVEGAGVKPNGRRFGWNRFGETVMRPSRLPQAELLAILTSWPQATSFTPRQYTLPAVMLTSRPLGLFRPWPI